MRCSKAQDFLSRELDEQLPPDATNKLQEHLDGCADCLAYRGDLALSRRLLAATEPTLPDNFEWKLQLRLNQALQRTVGEAAFPWHEERPDRGAWFRNFGAATAVGMAAVLALAMFAVPGLIPQTPVGAPVAFEQAAPAASDRLPLWSQPRQRGNLFSGGIQQNVSSRSGSAFSQSTQPRTGFRSWTGNRMDDQLIIRRQQDQIQQLNKMVYQYQRQLAGLRAHLDTTDHHTLDLE